MEIKLCRCGCGEQVKPNRDYIYGHNLRYYWYTKGVQRSGEKNPFYGRHHTAEAKAKMVAPHIGKPLSEEHKHKISQANIGRVISEKRRVQLLGNQFAKGKHWRLSEETKRNMPQLFKKGKAPWNKGKHNIRHLAEEEKEHLRQVMRGNLKCGRSGALNHNWQGGISFVPYTQEFNRQLKALIRMRDAYTCQLCGMPECENLRKLPIHHIDYNKSNSMPANLIALCDSCNAKVNFNRDYWFGYFRELLNQRQINPKALVKPKRNQKICSA